MPFQIQDLDIEIADTTERCWVLSTDYSTFFEIIIWLFSILLMWKIMLIDFLLLSIYSLYAWLWNKILIYCWIILFSIFIFFIINKWRKIDLYFYFVSLILSNNCTIKIMLGSQMSKFPGGRNVSVWYK